MAALGRFGPPLALMAVIFALSSRRDFGAPGGLLAEIGPPMAHLGLYGLLFALVWRALGFRLTALAAAVTLLYGASDELHQSFVPGRDPSLVDLLTDAAGAAGAYGLLRLKASRARWP